MERVHEEQRSLLIIADDVEGEALQALVVNRLKGNLQVCVIRAPEFGTARMLQATPGGKRPFMQPSLEVNKNKIRKIFQREGVLQK